MKRTIATIFVLSLLSLPSLRGEPFRSFLQYEHWPYPSCDFAVRDSLERWNWDVRNEKSVRRVISQMRKMPDSQRNHRWKLEAGLLEAYYDFDEFNGDSTLFKKRMDLLYNESRKYDNKVFEARILGRFLNYYVERDESLVITSARKLEDVLPELTDAENDDPDVIDTKFRLATVYYTYGAYQRSEKLFKEILDSKVYSQGWCIDQRLHSYNDLALLQRNYYQSGQVR